MATKAKQGNGSRVPNGRLPKGWRMVQFGDVVRDINESEKNPIEMGLERYIGLEHIEPEDLHIKEWGDLTQDEVSFTKRFRIGQVLFGKRRAYQRKVAVAEFDGICSSDILTFEPKGNDLLPELLPFIVQSDRFFDHALGTSSGSLSPRTRWSQLRNFEFPLPSKNEQRQIADSLWAADQAEQCFSATRSDAQRLRRMIWLNFVSCGDYKTVKIGDVARVGNGTTPSRKNENYWADGDIPWLSSGKIHDRNIVEADEYITSAALNKSPSMHFLAGSVLVAMIGQGKTRGTAAHLSFDACINQNLAAIVPGDSVDSWYLFYCLDNHYEQLRKSSHGSNQEALNCRLVAAFPIPLPRIEKQRQLARSMRAIERFEIRASAHVDVLHKLKQQVGRELLTAHCVS